MGCKMAENSHWDVWGILDDRSQEPSVGMLGKRLWEEDDAGEGNASQYLEAARNDFEVTIRRDDS